MGFTDDELLLALPRLRNYAGRLTRDRDDTHDLVSTTVVRALDNRERCQQGHIDGWLGTIAHNAHLYGVRKTAREVQLEVDRRTAPGASPEETAYAMEVVRGVDDDLTDLQVTVMCMAAEGWSPTEMAVELEKTVQAIRDLLHKARLKMRRLR